MIHKPITHYEASRILSDVHHSKHFRTKSNVSVKNLDELYNEIRKMSDDEFNHHLSPDKNDFKEWIHHAVNDFDLAEELAKCKTKQQILGKLNSRIEHLHQIKTGPVYPHKTYMDYALYDFLGGIIFGLLVGLVMATFV